MPGSSSEYTLEKGEQLSSKMKVEKMTASKVKDVFVIATGLSLAQKPFGSGIVIFWKRNNVHIRIQCRCSHCVLLTKAEIVCECSLFSRVSFLEKHLDMETEFLLDTLLKSANLNISEYFYIGTMRLCLNTFERGGTFCNKVFYRTGLVNVMRFGEKRERQIWEAFAECLL